MRRIVLLIVCSVVMISCSTTSLINYKSYAVDKIPENVNVNGNVVNYSIPQTEIVFKVTYNKITKTKGIFASQSNLLGLKNVVMENEIIYSVKDIEFSSRPVSNNENQYALVFNDSKVMVKKTPTNVLKSIEGFQEPSNYIEKRDLQRRMLKPKKEKKTKNFLQEPKPIFEAVLQKNNMLETLNLSAAEVVEKIDQIRERQMDLLSGSVDGNYSDASISYMYKQMDKMIEGYLSLFTGTQTQEEEVKYYYIIPKKPLLAAVDLQLPLADEPIALIARFHTKSTTDKFAESNKKMSLTEKGEPKEVALYYSVPEEVEISVDANGELYKKTILINQYGSISSMEIAPNNVYFYPQTGAIRTLNTY